MPHAQYVRYVPTYSRAEQATLQATRLHWVTGQVGKDSVGDTVFFSEGPPVFGPSQKTVSSSLPTWFTVYRLQLVQGRYGTN